MSRLIPENLPEARWLQFDGCGFSEQVSGLIYRMGRAPCCGVPLGGISSGCIDLDARGVYGYSTVFHPSSYSHNGRQHNPRKLPRVEPILALAVGEDVWVLASPEIVTGGTIDWCTDPGNAEIDGGEVPQDSIALPRLEGVRAVEEIEYWGHYPVVDMEFTSDSPVQVGLRAWSPFIPGDAAASSIPAAIFETHLRNRSDRVQQGTVAFNFLGPDTHEALSGEFGRQIITEDFRGVLVASSAGVQYVAGIIGEKPIRVGGGLGSRPDAWAGVATDLPQPAFGQREGHYLSDDASSAIAVDFELEPGQCEVVRFLLTWYAPIWEGASNNMHLTGDNNLRTPWLGSKWAGEVNHYTEMYASRYDGAVDVARRMASEHEALLKRVLAWQEVVYAEDELPVWLRDSLINSLALIAEDSHWAQAKAPLGDWCYPEGVFALDESPRGCPHMACIPCDWYGNLPIVFFFPELALSTLRAFKHYQLEDGEIPFALGKGLDLPDFATPEYYWQVSLNGTCYVDMVDRVWQRTGDRRVLEEFYDSVKACNTFTIDLNAGPGGVISMPEIGGMEWFEFGEWAGMATHMGGLRLAQLRIMERMAEAMGDEAYAERCRQWLASGSRAMEEEMWAGDYYLNFWDKQTGKKSEAVMGYQLDGQWMALFHGLPGVFREDRVKGALETINECNIALTPEMGAANFANRDGTPLTGDSEVAKYGPYAMFSAEVLVLAMTYIHAGQDEFGLDLARRYWENLVCRQLHPWDLPCIVRGDTGERVTGTDYYQNMMLWALPAAITGQDIKSYCASGGLVDRILAAGSPHAGRVASARKV